MLVGAPLPSTGIPRELKTIGVDCAMVVCDPAGVVIEPNPKEMPADSCCVSPSLEYVVQVVDPLVVQRSIR